MSDKRPPNSIFDVPRRLTGREREPYPLRTMGLPNIWPSTAGAKQGRWLWNGYVDVHLNGGALFFPFAQISIPNT